MIVNKEFVVVTWPEIQEYMEKEGFKDNSHLINDEVGLEKYGGSSYFINKEWLQNA